MLDLAIMPTAERPLRGKRIFIHDDAWYLQGVLTALEYSYGAQAVASDRLPGGIPALLEQTSGQIDVYLLHSLCLSDEISIHSALERGARIICIPPSLASENTPELQQMFARLGQAGAIIQERGTFSAYGDMLIQACIQALSGAE